MSKVTLKDIAKIANISSAAVSIILNDKPSRISEEKKAEVKKIASELNYRPNKIARSLLSTSTKTIGILIPDIENPFFIIRTVFFSVHVYNYAFLRKYPCFESFSIQIFLYPTCYIAITVTFINRVFHILIICINRILNLGICIFFGAVATCQRYD